MRNGFGENSIPTCVEETTLVPRVPLESTVCFSAVHVASHANIVKQSLPS